MPVSLSDSVSMADDVVVTEVGEEVVFLHAGSEEYFGLDPVGADMWKAMTESDSLRDASNRLLELYDVDPATLKADLLELVEQLEGRGLIRVQAG